MPNVLCKVLASFSLLASVCWTAPAAAQTRPAAEQVLIESNAAWIAAINAGDHATGLGSMTDDAALIGPAGPVTKGIENVRAGLTQITSNPGFHIEFTLVDASVASDGATGFVVGDARIGSPGPDGVLRAQPQRLLTVWRKDEKGEWRCWLDVVIPLAQRPASGE